MEACFDMTESLVRNLIMIEVVIQFAQYAVNAENKNVLFFH